MADRDGRLRSGAGLLHRLFGSGRPGAPYPGAQSGNGSRRRVVLGLAAVSTLGLIGAGASKVLFDPDRPRPSTSRTWLSGYAGDNSAHGRSAWAQTFFPPQVSTTYMDYESSWGQRAADVGLNRGNFLPPVSDGSAINLLTIGLTLCGPGGSTTMNNPGLAAAADGSDTAFGQGFTGIGLAIRAAGLNSPSTVIRLGHEMNSFWYPWATNNVPAVAAHYILAWRRAHSALRAVCPRIRFDECWNTGGSVDSLRLHYAGDSYVDIIGTDFYDFQEAKSQEAVHAEQGGMGLGDSGAFAAAHGKRLSLDEWGVNGNNPDQSTRDNPVYVRWIYQTLAGLEASHPGLISHDSYFDEMPYFQLGKNPRAEAAYRALWRPTDAT